MKKARQYILYILLLILLWLIIDRKPLVFHYSREIGIGESPVFSPDGQNLAFSDPHSAVIHVITLEGKEILQIVDDDPGVEVGALEWLTNEQIVYERIMPREHSFQFWMVDLKSQIKEPLNKYIYAYAYCPNCGGFDVSPSQKQILFAQHFGDQPEISILDFDSQDITTLAPPLGSEWLCVSPSWSPDSQHFIYTCIEQNRDKGMYRSQVWFAEVSTLKTYPISKIDESIGWNNLPTLNYQSISWSPNGRWVVYQGEEKCRLLNCSSIWLAPVVNNVPAFGQSVWIRTSKFTRLPTWNPSSKSLAYSGTGAMKDLDSIIWLMQIWSLH